MFECRKTSLLWSVVLDKINLLALQATSFCAVICKVGITFLRPLLSKPNNPAARPYHVKLTATMSNKDKLLAENLTWMALKLKHIHL